jgi:hypothetical protein
MAYGHSASDEDPDPRDTTDAAIAGETDADIISADLPAFLTDEPHAHALNGAAD